MNEWLEEIRRDLEQEREDFAPRVRCPLCGWKHPDVNLCPICRRCEVCCPGHAMVDETVIEQREAESIEMERRIRERERDLNEYDQERFREKLEAEDRAS